MDGSEPANLPPPAAPSAAGGAEPLIDKAGRTYASLVALGKKLLPRLNRNGWFMPKSPGRTPGKKSKTKMETPTPTNKPVASSPAENGAAGSPPPQPPDFSDVAAALKSAPKDDAPASPEKLAEEIAALDENSTAATIIGIIQTGLVLISEEEGVLSPLEIDLVRRPLVRVLKKYNVGENVMPAEVDLALALLGLVVARLRKPKTATAFAKFKFWLMEKGFSMQGKQLAAQVRAHTPAL